MLPSVTPGFENNETSQQWNTQGQVQPMLSVPQPLVPLQQPAAFPQLYDDSEGSSARRPPNAFILYSQAMRTQVRQENPTLSNTEVSSLLGKMWKEVPNETKLQYKQQAQQLQEAFKKAHPDYTYRKARKKRALNELLTKSQMNYANPDAFAMGQQYPVGYPYSAMAMPLQPPLASQVPQPIPTIPAQPLTIPQATSPATQQGVPQLYQNSPNQINPEQ